MDTILPGGLRHTENKPPHHICTFHTGAYDAVLMVGALSDGQVPCSAIPELLRVTKPGEKQPDLTLSTPKDSSLRIPEANQVAWSCLGSHSLT